MYRELSTYCISSLGNCNRARGIVATALVPTCIAAHCVCPEHMFTIEEVLVGPKTTSQRTVLKGNPFSCRRCRNKKPKGAPPRQVGAVRRINFVPTLWLSCRCHPTRHDTSVCLWNNFNTFHRNQIMVFRRGGSDASSWLWPPQLRLLTEL